MSHLHPGPVEVRGGSGGIAADLDDLDLAATALLTCSRAATDVLAAVSSLAVNPEMWLGAALSPATAGRVVASLAVAAGPAGLAGDVAALTALGEATRAVTATYRYAEQEATRIAGLAENVVMAVVGTQLPRLLVGVLALHAAGVDVGRLADRTVYRHPRLADLGGGVSGLVAGVGATGVGFPRTLPAPRSYEDGVRALAGMAGDRGMLADMGAAKVTAEALPRAGAAAPANLEALAYDLANLSDGERYPGHVRVTQVQQGGRSAWLVEVSGTQVWDPAAGGNPFDVTSDVHAMARDATVLADGVAQALEQAQLSTGRSARDLRSDPVLLAGHSLGGIVAAGLASSSAFTARHHVTHVVTMGSPVARMPVQAGIQVLSLEHRQDAVPRLEGRPNPDRQDWVTVIRDLEAEQPPPGAARARTTSAAHSSSEYAVTAAAADRSAEPSLASWREGSRDFFSAGSEVRSTVRDYRIQRGHAER